jgi:hypothetical protein
MDSSDRHRQLIESLLLAWQKKKQQQVMLSACLALDEKAPAEEGEWQQAAITDWDESC